MYRYLQNNWCTGGVRLIPGRAFLQYCLIVRLKGFHSTLSKSFTELQNDYHLMNQSQFI